MAETIADLAIPQEIQNRAGRLIGQRHGLNRQLLAGLKSLLLGAFVCQIGINHLADPGGDAVP